MAYRVFRTLAGTGTEHQFSTGENLVVTRSLPVPASFRGSGFSVFRNPRKRTESAATHGQRGRAKAFLHLI